MFLSSLRYFTKELYASHLLRFLGITARSSLNVTSMLRPETKCSSPIYFTSASTSSLNISGVILSDLGRIMALKFLNLIICGEALLFVYLGFPTVYCQGFIFLGVG